jgi:hypothetical protein
LVFAATFLVERVHSPANGLFGSRGP